MATGLNDEVALLTKLNKFNIMENTLRLAGPGHYRGDLITEVATK